jgi:hypothetical protein
MTILKNKTKHQADEQSSGLPAEINDEPQRVRDQNISGRDKPEGDLLTREELESGELPAAADNTRKRRRISEEVAAPSQPAQPSQLATPAYPYFSGPGIQPAKEQAGDKSSPSNEKPGEGTSLSHKLYC